MGRLKDGSCKSANSKLIFPTRQPKLRPMPNSRSWSVSEVFSMEHVAVVQNEHEQECSKTSYELPSGNFKQLWKVSI